MIDVLIPIVKDPDTFLRSMEELKERKDVRFIVGITSSVAKSANFDLPNMIIKIYRDGSKREEIINALQSSLQGDKTFIARKPFTKEEFEKFTSSKADIVICQKHKQNAFSQFFVRLWTLMIKYIFGVKFFAGDTSLIYFNSELGEVLTRVTDLSYSTRVDRWKGIKQEIIPSTSAPAKIDRDTKRNLLLLLYAFIALAVAVTVTTVVAIFTKVNVVTALFLVCLDCISLSVAFLLLMSFLFNQKIGKKRYLKALEV